MLACIAQIFLSILTLAFQHIVFRIGDKFFIQMLLHAEKFGGDVGRKRTLLPRNEIREVTEKGMRTGRIRNVRVLDRSRVHVSQ